MPWSDKAACMIAGAPLTKRDDGLAGPGAGRDTVAVTLAARDHRVTRLAAGLPDGARWAVAGHAATTLRRYLP